ncbi:hypothetical protein GQ53DRAFT_828385 [Thozetella sp. PMI_491]|nr:hypothetical protein GQ53DRAFT_828385 [Thozetella sp. PMI_491]
MRSQRRPLWLLLLLLPIYTVQLPARALVKGTVAWARWRLNWTLRHGRRSVHARSHITEKSQVQQTSPFLRLPAELRLRIYKYAVQGGKQKHFRTGGCIVQPGVGLGAICVESYGPYPSAWQPDQRIRSDADPPSSILPRLLALGASAIDTIVFPPSRGCVRYGCACIMLCGDTDGVWPGTLPTASPLSYCDVTTLLRVCRTFYTETLSMLYADNTFSLFGVEMIPFVERNVSPDGLHCVRYVHLILRLDAARWADAKRKREVTEAMKCLKSSFSGLRQLDLEVVITWGQPAAPNQLWNWLTQDLLGQLTGLDELVLKVSVLKPLAKPEDYRYGYDDWTPEIEALSSWNVDDYQKLKLTVGTTSTGNEG